MKNLMTDDERLALLTAISKNIDAELKQLKSAAKAELNEIMYDTGADRKPIKIGDEKVGEIALTYHKPCPVIIDHDASIDYLRDLGLTKEVPISGWESCFSRCGEKVVHTDSGEICDFMQWQGRIPNYAKITGCDAVDVKNSLESKYALNGMSNWLLGE